jgi:hypothetical protein
LRLRNWTTRQERPAGVDEVYAERTGSQSVADEEALSLARGGRKTDWCEPTRRDV